MQTFSWKFVDDFNFLVWLCLVFTAAHGPSLVGASGATVQSWCVGFSFNTFLYHSLEMGIFLMSTLSSFFLSLFLFFASIFYGLLVRLDLCNITLALLLREIYRYWLSVQSISLSPFNLIHFPLSSLYFLSSLLLDFCLGSCGIKSSYVENHTLFRIGCLRSEVTWLCFQAKCCLGFCLFDFNFYNYSLDATLLMANGWIH